MLAADPGTAAGSSRVLLVAIDPGGFILGGVFSIYTR